MKKAILIGLTLISLMACETKNGKPDKEEEQKILQNQKENLISKLTEKYAVEYLIDTLRYNYSIQFEELLKTDYQIVSNFMINDIYRRDSLVYISLRVFSYPAIHLNLEISPNQIGEILKLEKKLIMFIDGVFVIKLSEINKGEFGTTGTENLMSFWGKGQVFELNILN